MLTEEAWERARAWCDAWNGHDLNAIMEHYSEDVVFSSPTVIKRWNIADGQLTGKARLRDHFALGLQAPGLHFQLLDVLVGVNAVCIVYRRENGALVSDCIDLDGLGKATRVLACYGQPRSG